MSIGFLNDKTAPYCPGCGHNSVNISLNKILANLNLEPLDIVVVSDIGCCGLVDGLLNSHTVHGLHGRSPALALGVSLGLDNPNKKVLVIIGDGGATIGLQHVLEAARQNVNIMLLLLNNIVYGMTGGQISGLTPGGFKEKKMPEAEPVPPFNVCELAYNAGGAYCARVFFGKNLQPALETALSTDGFSMVEVVEMCPSYALKKVNELKEVSDHDEVFLSRERRAQRTVRRETVSLLNSLEVIEKQYDPNLDSRIEIIIAGGAGEAIQTAGDLLASAGMASGLHATKKGEYPVTIGTGFSVSEVICAREPIHYTGTESLDLLFILSEEGYKKIKNLIKPGVSIIADRQFEGVLEGDVLFGDFQKLAGRRGAALCAISAWLLQEKVVPLQALLQAAKSHKHADKLVAAIMLGEQVAWASEGLAV